MVGIIGLALPTGLVHRGAAIVLVASDDGRSIKKLYVLALILIINFSRRLC